MEQIKKIARLYPVIMRVMGRIRSVVHEGLDLTYNQYKMLLTIYDKGSCPLNQLARELQIAMSSASEMVDRLVNLGIVARTTAAGDRRQVVIHTTEQGEELIRELQSGIVENYRLLLDRLSPQDQERLVQSFETLAEILGKLE